MTETTVGPKVHSFRVNVTPDCIQDGKIKNSSHCMIAEAVKRQFMETFKRPAYGVSVDLQTVRLTDRKHKSRYIYLTPASAQRELVRFDQGLTTTPFKLILSSNNCQVIPSMAGSDEAMKNLRRNAKRARAAKLRVKPGRDYMNRQRKVGGKSPPKAVLTGTRRQFGIKALGEIS